MLLKNKKALTITLWTIQGLLAALFLFAGAMKLTMPIEAMTKQMPMPGAFLRFIGVAEVFGALGLVLPALLKIRPALTPLAASGLIIIMVGATVLSWMIGGITAALFPFIIALLLAFVAYNRSFVLTARA